MMEEGEDEEKEMGEEGGENFLKKKGERGTKKTENEQPRSTAVHSVPGFCWYGAFDNT